MNNTLMKKNKKGLWIAAGLLVLLYVVLFLLDNFIPQTPATAMLIPVLKKGAIYSLLCVSMNLLNGFTGLFSQIGRAHV